MKYTGTNKRTVIIVTIIVTTVLLGVLGFLTIQHIKKTATITIEYAPVSATAFINNKKASKDNKVEPGTYEVVIKKDGFRTNTQKVTVKNKEIKTVLAVLSPNSDSTKDWYSNNEEDQNMAQYIFDSKAAEDAAAAASSFKISSILPYIGPKYSYRIDYGVSKKKKSKQAVYISYYTDSGKKAAQDYIVSKGYKLEDYEIIYSKVRLNPETLENEPVEE